VGLVFRLCLNGWLKDGSIRRFLTLATITFLPLMLLTGFFVCNSTCTPEVLKPCFTKGMNFKKKKMWSIHHNHVNILSSCMYFYFFCLQHLRHYVNFHWLQDFGSLRYRSGVSLFLCSPTEICRGWCIMCRSE
jgi:hypothetical protein